MTPFSSDEILALIREGRTVHFREDGSVKSVSTPSAASRPMTPAEKQKAYRLRQKESVTEKVTPTPENVTFVTALPTGNAPVSPSTPPPSAYTGLHTHGREEAPPDVEIFPEACTIEQARQMAEMAGVPKEAAEAWWYDHDKRGWIDRQGHRVRNARSSIVAFGRQWQSFEAKQERELQAKRDAVTARMNGNGKPSRPLSRMENIEVHSTDL